MLIEQPDWGNLLDVFAPATLRIGDEGSYRFRPGWRCRRCDHVFRWTGFYAELPPAHVCLTEKEFVEKGMEIVRRILEREEGKITHPFYFSCGSPSVIIDSAHTVCK